MHNELELMNIQAEVLFAHDSLGRITKINEFEGHPAPRLFWGKTNKISSIWMGPAYVFADHHVGASQAVKVTNDNREYLEPGFKKVLTELQHREPCYMVIEDNKAVSVCFSARNTDRAAEAGIETLEEYRGKGYAIAVASAWLAAVHVLGKVALYSTS